MATTTRDLDRAAKIVREHPGTKEGWRLEGGGDFGEYLCEAFLNYFASEAPPDGFDARDAAYFRKKCWDASHVIQK